MNKRRGAASDQKSGHFLDAFISHAGEDKATVARPLADALTALGWDVWLDELRLTVGDSLSRQIDVALARSRFGIVILSPSFFAKAWPQRELAGLAARELASESKIILPVWHEVDHTYIAGRSPTLADRVGARTEAGIERVAEELSEVFRDPPSEDNEFPREVAIDAETEDETSMFRIPVTDEDQEGLLADRPEWWEYRLYAGVLMQGRLGLEAKWLDHDLRIPGGQRRHSSEPTSDFISQEMGTMRRFLTTFNRVFDPQILEQAFGPSGEAGNPDRIRHLAGGVLRVYESMLDWSAELRNTTVPGEYVDLVELIARMADRPVRQIRDFIQLVADEIAGIPLLLLSAESAAATEESPMILTLSLSLDVDPVVQEEFSAELERMTRG